jgi:2',3'-cyclic-nucleotide 2'-phosphodiesterase (5'-nucleotidase family)
MKKDNNLSLIQINDVHAYLDLHTELFWNGSRQAYGPAGGYGRIAAAMTELREARPGQVLTLDGGDTLHGTHPAVDTEGEALIPILNSLGFDAMTAHWEFAYGPQRLQEIARHLNFPILANNCFREGTSQLVFPGHKLYERSGFKVGVIGIAAYIVDKTMPDHFSKGVCFTLGNQELPAAIQHLRQQEGADIIVVLSHLGFPQDVKLASEVPGIDVLLSAHTHNRLYRPARVNDTLIIQSGSHGSFIGVLDLSIEHGRVQDYRHELVRITENIQPDPDVQALVDHAMAPYRAEREEVLGSTATPLNRMTALEATMDNLLLQSLLAETGDTLAFSNGWRYGAPVKAGPITKEDIWNIIPVNPPISQCEMSGADLLEMMEENLEHTFARDPYNQMGGFVKRALGLNMYVKIENPAGHRIQEFYVGNEMLDPDRRYHVTYVTEQGVPRKYGENHRQSDVRAVDALERYIHKQGTVNADLRGTVTVV